jgi:hypothetical protein
VRKSLQDALYRAYPALFCQKHLPPEERGMGSGIECGDGWYGILDGLCDVLTSHGRQPGHPSIVATQVKEKFGDLRFYVHGNCAWCRGAIRFASAISRHVCEETGRPGVLMVRARSLKTLAEDVGHAKNYHPAAIDDDLAVEGSQKPTEDDLPSGWISIARALRSITADEEPLATLRFARSENTLVVHSDSNEGWLSGEMLCAIRVAARTNPSTGAMLIPASGDVDANGHVHSI